MAKNYREKTIKYINGKDNYKSPDIENQNLVFLQRKRKDLCSELE